MNPTPPAPTSDPYIPRMVTGGMIGVAALSLIGILVCAVTHTEVPSSLPMALQGCLIGLGVIFTPGVIHVQGQVPQVQSQQPQPKLEEQQPKT